MKKILSIVLAVAMLLSTLALVGCTNDADKKDEGKKTETLPAVDSLEALTTIWDSYEEDNRFSIVGGDAANSVMGAPGAYDLADAEAVNTNVGVPADKVSTVKKAATLIHMMNANTFTAAAIEVAEGNTVEDVAKIVGDNLKDRQWMCGIPEKHIIVKVGANTMISVFGANDLMEVFTEKLNAAYPKNTVILEQTFE